jgi:hypothetical protein
MLTEKGDSTFKLLGTLVVYVDDFLLQAEAGPIRDSALAALGQISTLDMRQRADSHEGFSPSRSLASR